MQFNIKLLWSLHGEVNIASTIKAEVNVNYYRLSDLKTILPHRDSFFRRKFRNDCNVTVEEDEA